MLLITEVKYIEVNKDSYLLQPQRLAMNSMVAITDIAGHAHIVAEEVVQGHIYVDHTGQEFMVGMTSVVAQRFGLTLEVAENLSNAKDKAVEQQKFLKAENKIMLDQIKNASVWQRLKYLMGARIL